MMVFLTVINLYTIVPMQPTLDLIRSFITAEMQNTDHIESTLKNPAHTD